MVAYAGTVSRTCVGNMVALCMTKAFPATYVQEADSMSCQVSCIYVGAGQRQLNMFSFEM